MRTIGVLGGMSAESTGHYYAVLNSLVRDRAGGLSSADLLIRSIDFAPMAAMQKRGAWDEAGEWLAAEAQSLEVGGAELLLLATNTMHFVVDQITAAITVPLIHIADATAQRISQAGLGRPGLIATAFTMDQPFYVDRLAARGLETIIPPVAERAEIHRIIYEELCVGVVNADSRAVYEQVVQALIDQGADSIILGCTEVGMLLSDENVKVPVFDTSEIHCEAAVAAAFEMDGGA